MKRSIIALAALTAFAGAASAQSSVTVFGLFDVNMRSVDNGTGAGTLKTLSTAGINTPRLGFRGIEDLGGGLRAGFWLEGEIAPDVGGGAKTAATANGNTANGQDWQRRATVSLIGNFGEIRLGRDETPTFKNWGAEPFNTNGVATGYNLRSGNLNASAAAGPTSGVTTNVRASNSIGYILPALGGLFGQAMVAAGEGVQGNKYVGGRLGYAAGPISVAVAYGKTYKTGTMTDDYKVSNFGGSYNLGFMTIGLVYEQSTYDIKKQKVAYLPITVPFGAGTFRAQYTKSGGNIDFDAKMWGLAYQYDLSKRTALYTSYGSISNNNPGGGRGAAFTASNGGNTLVRGQDSKGYEFGIRHFF